MSTVTLSGEEYDTLRNARVEAENEAAKLRAELALAKAQDPLDRIQPLNALARDLMTIMRFACANLPPETIRGWPVDALKRISKGLVALPDHTGDDVTLGIDLMAIYREIVECEDIRAARARPVGGPPIA